MIESLMSSALFWVALGSILVCAEVATPGFVLMFFGLSAFTIAALVSFIPVEESPWPLWPALAFVAFSIAYIALLRRYLRRVFRGHKESAQDSFDNFTGRSATVLSAIAPGAVGKIEFHGTHWEATSDAECPEGSRVTIVRKESLTLTVKPAN